MEILTVHQQNTPLDSLDMWHYMALLPIFSLFFIAAVDIKPFRMQTQRAIKQWLAIVSEQEKGREEKMANK